MSELNLLGFAEGGCIEVDKGNLKCKLVINSVAINRENSHILFKKLTHENI